MRLYHFTSAQNFKGYVEAIYDRNNLLWKISFACATNLSKEGIDWFKKNIPVLQENLEERFAEIKNITVTEKEFEVTFDDFKREYPYSRNMHLALLDWNKETSSVQYEIFIGAIEYNKHCKKNDKWYKPMLPQRFIKDKEYKNNWQAL